MPKYIFGKVKDEKQDGYDSEYESEDGTLYKPEEKIGAGAFAVARKFTSDANKKKAVLSPRDKAKINFKEVQNKYEFFNSIYPGEGTQLIKEGKTYRLILPLKPGKKYTLLKVNAILEQLELFLSAIQTLKECHAKQWIVIDLKDDNILYDDKTGKSYLVDGGVSAPKGHAITSMFQKKSTVPIEEARKKRPFYAPECFTLIDVPAKATESMDIYALGYMMETVLNNHFFGKNRIVPELLPLVKACQNQKPEDRPTLDQVEKQLTELLEDKRKLARDGLDATIQEINDLKVDFKDKTTDQEVFKHRSALLQQITKLTILYQGKNQPLALKQLISHKTKSIMQAAEEQIMLLLTQIEKEINWARQIIKEKTRTIENIEVTFSGKTIEQEIREHADLLTRKVDELRQDADLIKAYNLLVEDSDSKLELVCKLKKLDITEQATKSVSNLKEIEYVRNRLIEMLIKIEEHPFECYGGGKIVDGKTYSNAGLFIRNELQSVLSNEGASIGDYYKVLDKVKDELKDKRTTSLGFFGLGRRGQSSVDLYTTLFTDVADVEQNKSLNL